MDGNSIFENADGFAMSAAPPRKSNGYLVVRCAGGFSEQRVAVSVLRLPVLQNDGQSVEFTESVACPFIHNKSPKPNLFART